MNAMIRALCIILGMSASVWSQNTEQNRTDASAARGSISGRITIAGEAAYDMVVRLSIFDRSSNSRVVASTKTDPEGRFHMADIAAGRYLIGAFAPAHTGDSNHPLAVTLSNGQHIEGIEIELVLGGVITGRLLDKDGQPVVGQDVAAVSAEKDHRPALLSSRRFIGSDDRGVYRIYGLPPGRYLVRAGTDVENTVGIQSRKVQPLTFHPGVNDPNKAAVVRVESGGEVTGVDIVFGQPRTLFEATGRVVEAESGRPVVGAHIGWERLREDGSSSSSVGPSDDKGFFRLPGLGPGRFKVSAQVDGGNSYSDRVEFEVKDADVSGLTIRLYQGATISGVVQADAGVDRETLSTLRIWAIASPSREGRSDRTGSGGITDVSSEGTFQIIGLQAGETRIRLTGSRNNPAGFLISGIDHPLVQMVVREGAEPEGVLSIQPGDQISGLRIIVKQLKGGIRGTIKLAGGNLPLGAFLGVSIWSSRGSGTRVEVDPNGKFEVKGLAPGEYRVTAAVESRSPESPQSRSGMQAEKTISISDKVEDIELALDVSKPEKK